MIRIFLTSYNLILIEFFINSEISNINKSFGHVHANKDINLTINKGTIHGIIGENGAGKSTLMSIVYGLYQADSGKIKVSGKENNTQLINLDQICITFPRQHLKRINMTSIHILYKI